MNQSLATPAETADSATPVEMPASTRQKITEIFSREEIAQLTKKSDLMGWSALAFTWAVIVLCFVAMAWAGQQPLIIALPVMTVAIALLAGRQLALAILTHEASHKTLFRSAWLNEFAGDWLCARIIGIDMKKYRRHHFIHHTRTGTDEDSDISLVNGFPTTPASLRRKFLRDLVGLTGLKYVLGRLLMDAELMKWTVAADVTWLPRQSAWHHARAFLRNAAGMLLMNGLLLLALWQFGHAEIYGVWVLAYITPFPLFLRIRSLAEHACTEKTADMFLNTRTTKAGVVARALVAPIRVYFHIEHHVMASVPYFRLKKMHQMLRERGKVPPPPGYRDVLRLVSGSSAPLR